MRRARDTVLMPASRCFFVCFQGMGSVGLGYGTTSVGGFFRELTILACDFLVSLRYGFYLFISMVTYSG
jgi:hypothetical protein